MLVLFILLITVALSSIGCSAQPPPQPKIESVVLIGVDTLRADHLGLYGAKRPTSPALDQIAERARVFEHAYATAAWTLPSFASLLTGLDPAEHGAGIVLGQQADREWDPERIGNKERTKILPSGTTLSERLSAGGFKTFGVVQTPNLDPVYGFDRGFDIYENYRFERRRRADAAVAIAFELIDRHQDQPFFLFLHLIDPHLDYDAPTRFAGQFTNDIDAGLELPVSVDNVNQLREESPEQLSVKTKFVEAAYDEEIAYTDRQIARFLDGLNERGLEDETLVILTSDHGEEFFEHGGFEHGHSMHQELLRVPFMVWGPGVTPGRESAPISIADAAPTILEAVGLEVPDAGFGQSLWPMIDKSEPGDMDRLIVAAGTLYGPELRMAMRWPYKLIQNPKTGKLALFNLEKDPGEKNDLIETHRQLAQRLAAELDHRMISISSGPQREGVELDDEMIKNLRELGYVE